jgi:hypothetical protein
MKIESFEQLVRSAYQLLQRHGKLSAPFLMRKFKIDHMASQNLMKKLGQDVWITAEDYHASKKRN